jgi:hypothetical protein
MVAPMAHAFVPDQPASWIRAEPLTERMIRELGRALRVSLSPRRGTTPHQKGALLTYDVPVRGVHCTRAMPVLGVWDEAVPFAASIGTTELPFTWETLIKQCSPGDVLLAEWRRHDPRLAGDRWVADTTLYLARVREDHDDVYARLLVRAEPVGSPPRPQGHRQRRHLRLLK